MVQPSTVIVCAALFYDEQHSRFAHISISTKTRVIPFTTTTSFPGRCLRGMASGPKADGTTWTVPRPSGGGMVEVRKDKGKNEFQEEVRWDISWPPHRHCLGPAGATTLCGYHVTMQLEFVSSFVILWNHHPTFSLSLTEAIFCGGSWLCWPPHNTQQEDLQGRVMSCLHLHKFNTFSISTKPLSHPWP